ncbi:hypothetical protein EJ06DRAFT_425803 [Trichodelitschia bisporula]|uniref:Concanavalin A-like lectin/glucanase n=1 Tax=Trichodelitschia bisporula TaxID=703511 RepID=A0A6G1HW76_9PEZI|nr:hypothetical protein EJ06DRAFT_425803 [Trichodelitschia bisporula]
MSYFLDYVFTSKQVANPDGSLPVTLAADATIGTGPGAFQGQNFPQAARLGSGPIQVDIKNVEVINEARFNGSVVFQADALPGRQTLVESERLPFMLELVGTGNSVKLVVSVKIMGSTAWRGTDTFSSPTLTTGWHLAQFAYDMDTLFLFIDGNPAGCHGFGTTGNIALSDAVKTIVIGGKDAANRFMGQLASVRVGFGIPIELEPIMDGQRFSPVWFITTKLEMSRLVMDMGVPTSNTTFSAVTATWSQNYNQGVIMYHSAASSAFLMYGIILQRYRALSDATRSALGYLVTDETSAYVQGARKSLFQGGGIYWSSATGAFEVTAQLYLHYEATGESQDWGLPVEPPQNVPNGVSQRMQRATALYRNGSPSAHIVIGSIRDAYQNTGGPTKWGFPLSDEMIVKGVKDGNVERNVRLSKFEGCDIYWSPQTNAHIIYGDIRAKWMDLKGPLSGLGLPVTDEMDIPGGGRTNGFENGAITWYGSFSSIQIINPFKFFVGNLNTVESEGLFMGQNDLYFSATINEDNNTLYRERFPSSGSWDGRNDMDVNIEFPTVMTPNPTKQITVVLDVWDSDGGAPFGGGDDHLGTWTKQLNSANAWGLRENNGIFSSGGFAKINNITSAVHPQVNLSALTELEKYWGAGARNRGNDPISYQTYAEAFRDVDSSPEVYDPLDWLDKAFYEAVAKHLAKGGNCFGMSLEAIYARHGLSLFSLPINRFGDWNQLQPVFNVKHLYQVGAAPIWWFVGTFLAGNTHNPVRVFNDSRDRFNSGDHPVLCISQNVDFSGAPHTIYPIGWDSSSRPWKISIHDPNFPDQIRTIEVDNTNNTWKYDGGNLYAGAEWSGGRLHYMPWSVLNAAPRTPVWDAILLILAGTIIVMGNDTETASLNSADGGDLSAHSGRAIRALQAGRKLDGYFVNTPIMFGDGGVGELKFTSGYQAPNASILPMQPASSALSSLLSAGTPINLNPLLPLTALESRLTPFQPTNNFQISVRGKQGGGTHQQLVKSGTTQFTISAPIDQGETTHIEAKALGTVNSEITVASARAKTHTITLMQRMGMTHDSVVMKFDLTATAPGAITLLPKPGLGLIELKSVAARLSSAKLDVTSMVAGKVNTHSFNMVQPGGLVLEGRLRLKVPVGLDKAQVGISTLDAAGGDKVLGSRLVAGQRVGGILGGLGQFAGLASRLQPGVLTHLSDLTLHPRTGA